MTSSELYWTQPGWPFLHPYAKLSWQSSKLISQQETSQNILCRVLRQTNTFCEIGIVFVDNNKIHGIPSYHQPYPLIDGTINYSENVMTSYVRSMYIAEKVACQLLQG